MSALSAVGQKRHVPVECTDSQLIRWRKRGTLVGLSQHGIALACSLKIWQTAPSNPAISHWPFAFSVRLRINRLVNLVISPATTLTGRAKINSGVETCKSIFFGVDG